MKTTFHRAVVAAIVAVFVPVAALAQNIATSNLSWEAEEVNDLQTSAKVSMRCTFKTNAGATVEWIQKKGELTTLYTITSTEGSWPDVSAMGSCTYVLERKGKYCRMTLERNADGLFITMDFSKAGEYEARHRFKIKSVQ